MASAGNGTATLYAKLQDRYLARDQVGATGVFHELVKAGRPLAEIARETVRVHAPYTHVPYHQRIDRGFVRFVNNDHCLLSTRASLFLPAYVAPELAYLPHGPDGLVRADGARPVEPAPRRGARALRAPRVEGRQDAAVPDADGALAG